MIEVMADRERPELGPRKSAVLCAVVEQYVREGEPVSSESIADHAGLGVSSATIRNEMAALSTLGYLRQPHTSAGRVPSDKGYRFYVDRLMEADAAAPRLPRTHFDAELDEVLRQTCRILCGITRCAAVGEPAMMPAMCVPWPNLSPTVGSPGMKLTAATTLPASASCAAMPESTIATPTPSPVTPG